MNKERTPQEIAEDQFIKFRNTIDTTDFTLFMPEENGVRNVIHSSRVMHNPGGDEASNIYNRLCTDYLNGIDS